jgi:hypothetical protein
VRHEILAKKYLVKNHLAVMNLIVVKVNPKQAIIGEQSVQEH